MGPAADDRAHRRRAQCGSEHCGRPGRGRRETSSLPNGPCRWWRHGTASVTSAAPKRECAALPPPREVACGRCLGGLLAFPGHTISSVHRSATEAEHQRRSMLPGCWEDDSAASVAKVASAEESLQEAIVPSVALLIVFPDRSSTGLRVSMVNSLVVKLRSSWIDQVN